MAVKQFKLPDLGEGLTEGEILHWLVQPGDEVRLNQPIVEVETAKAAVEVPSPFAGVVQQLLHAEGETVDVGTPIISFEVAGEAAAGAAGEVAEARAAVGTEMPAHGDRTSVLVGYGPRTREARRRPRRKGDVAAAVADTGRPQVAERMSGEAVAGNAAVTVLAKPPVRKLAKDLGVDLRDVEGSGPGGIVTREDVQSAAGGAEAPPASPRVVPAESGVREERIPVKGVRKHMAAAMVSSAFTVPHVTEFLTCDVTATMDLVARLRQAPGFEGAKVSPLLVVARALIAAVRRNPLVNSSWDEEHQEIVVRHYVNLGIAAATPRGLVVPNVKDADRLSLRELADALEQITTTAREGKTPPADMSGGTITITNVGVFGVDTGTPIINPGEAAILAFGAVRDMPWVHEGQLAVRKVTQLGLSFDHRIIDGQLGSRFLADVGAMLTDPSLLVAWG